MRKTLVFLLIFASLSLFGQIRYERGYIVFSNGEKKNCMIKNEDWLNSPQVIRYRCGGKSGKAGVKEIKEFGIYNGHRYVRYTGKVNHATDNLVTMNHSPEPDWVRDTVFLKVLVKGDASLYKYRKSNIEQFFYSVGGPIKPMIYKKYLSQDGGTLMENNQFRKQLFEDLQCASLKMQDFTRLRYEEKDLMVLFKKYNKCKNGYVETYKMKNQTFHLYAEAGLGLTSMSLNNDRFTVKEIKFDKKAVLVPGICLEYVFPFNRNKISAILGFYYQQYSGQKSVETGGVQGGSLDIEAEYKGLYFPAGGRYYVYVNTDFYVFGQAQYGFLLPFKSSRVEMYREDGSPYNELEFSKSWSLDIGIGAGYKAFQILFRYRMPSNPLNAYQLWNSDYKTFGFIISYKIF